MDTLYTDPIFLNFGIYCLLVFSLYQFFDKAFKHYNTHYQKQKKDVQDYVISNITKSVILLIIAIYNYNIIKSYLYYDYNTKDWRNPICTIGVFKMNSRLSSSKFVMRRIRSQPEL